MKICKICIKEALISGNCSHGRGFICNRIAFDAVTPPVYMAPIETDIETVSCGEFSKRFSSIGRVNGRKRRSRVDLKTVIGRLERSKSILNIVSLTRGASAKTLEKYLKRFRVNTSKQCRFELRSFKRSNVDSLADFA